MADASMDRDRHNIKDNVARWLSIIALILSLIALFTAMNAKNTANDAKDTANRIQSLQQTTR